MTSTNHIPTRHEAGSVVREEFGARQLAMSGEASSTAMSAQAKAEVEALFILAMRNPRDLDVVRQKLLKECRRPGFAKTARYYLPIGGGVSGPSVRFAEAAIAAMGNIAVQMATIYDDEHKRLVRVRVLDLERCVPYSRDVTVDKVVERTELRKGQVPISSRTNWQGKNVYLVLASENDLAAKEGAAIAKAMRTLSLKLVPPDILAECMDQVVDTNTNDAAKDPDAARKNLIDCFVGIGVPVLSLKSYIGHEIEALTPAEITELRAVYKAISEGHATWDEVMAAKRPDADEDEGKEQSKATRELKAHLERLRKLKDAPEAEESQETPAEGEE